MTSSATLETIDSIFTHVARAASLAILGLLTWALVTLHKVEVSIARIEVQVGGAEYRIRALEQRVSTLEGESRRRR